MFTNYYICSMEANELIYDSLNEQQLLMLRLLKNPLPDQVFQQIRQLAVKLLAKQLDDRIDEWEQQNNITENDYNQLSKGHFRSNPKKA